MHPIFIASLFWLLASSAIADSPSPRELAEQDIAEQMQSCTDEGHEVTQKQNPLILADLDSDGILDAIVNNGALVCSVGWFYYGAAGPHISLYLSGSDKREHMMLRKWSIEGDEVGQVTFHW